MPSATDIAGEISSFLATGEARNKGELRGLAEAYAALCNEANDRLKMCGEYLRKGLRGEAIYHAEIEPDILDMVAALDIPRVDEWNAVCAGHGLDIPPGLRIKTAIEINTAYAEHDRIRELLTQIRMLAIVRAPLRERLAALRTLYELEPENRFLEEDLRSFEAARSEEIVAAGREAYRTGGLDTIRTLIDEMTGRAWLDRTVPGVVDTLSSFAKKLQEDESDG